MGRFLEEEKEVERDRFILILHNLARVIGSASVLGAPDVFLSKTWENGSSWAGSVFLERFMWKQAPGSWGVCLGEVTSQIVAGICLLGDGSAEQVLCQQLTE